MCALPPARRTIRWAKLRRREFYMGEGGWGCNFVVMQLLLDNKTTRGLLYLHPRSVSVLGLTMPHCSHPC